MVKLQLTIVLTTVIVAGSLRANVVRAVIGPYSDLQPYVSGS